MIDSVKTSNDHWQDPPSHVQPPKTINTFFSYSWPRRFLMGKYNFFTNDGPPYHEIRFWGGLSCLKFDQKTLLSVWTTVQNCSCSHIEIRLEEKVWSKEDFKVLNLSITSLVKDQCSRSFHRHRDQAIHRQLEKHVRKHTLLRRLIIETRGLMKFDTDAVADRRITELQSLL